jgi:phosphate/sulfate permease
MIIKVNILFLSFSLYYVMNACFFDEVTIHQIYEDDGEYKYSFFISPIILSFIFAYILSIILKYIFLSERNIIAIKKEITFHKAKEKAEKVKRIIIIKYIICFIGGFIHLIFSWFYLSSFGAVYQNTQVFLIKNTFISCFISLVYPFIINLLPGILRMNSLKDPNKNKELMFKVSKILQYI